MKRTTNVRTSRVLSHEQLRTVCGAEKKKVPPPPPPPPPTIDGESVDIDHKDWSF